MQQVTQLVDIIFNGIIAIIAAAGLLFGAWNLWDGFTNDQPESKKKAILTIIITVVVIVLIIAVKPIVLSFMDL